MKNKKCDRENKAEEFYPGTDIPMIRPRLNMLKAVALTVAVLAADLLLSYGIIRGASHFKWYESLDISFGWLFFVVFSVVFIISIFVFLKSIIFFMIRLYQRYGPYHIRCRCMYVPSCSTYMILAIEKYGLYKGLKKGIDRIKRCQGTNGGEDYP